MKTRLVVGRYQHYQGGYVRALDIGLLENGESCVIYTPDDGIDYGSSPRTDMRILHTKKVITFARWNETVNGEPRFKLVD